MECAKMPSEIIKGNVPNQRITERLRFAMVRITIATDK
jgi:hypothetical protein